MSDRFTHRCTEKECPHVGQRSTYGSCKCHQTREQMMMAHIVTLESSADSAWEIIREAIRTYDGFDSDEDFKVRECLDKIMGRIMERYSIECSAVPAPQVSGDGR